MTEELILSEEQLNEMAEELFERLAADQPEADTEISQVKATVTDTPVTELTPEAKDEIHAEAAKSLATAEHDPIVPPQMTRQVWKQMMRMHFTVRRGRAQPCGHKINIEADPRNNCENCWFTYFNNNKTMTEIADDCFQNAGRDILERSRGKKFTKMFLRFMSTLARLQKEEAQNAPVSKP